MYTKTTHTQKHTHTTLHSVDSALHKIKPLSKPFQTLSTTPMWLPRHTPEQTHKHSPCHPLNTLVTVIELMCGLSWQMKLYCTSAPGPRWYFCLASFRRCRFFLPWGRKQTQHYLLSGSLMIAPRARLPWASVRADAETRALKRSPERRRVAWQVWDFLCREQSQRRRHAALEFKTRPFCKD